MSDSSNEDVLSLQEMENKPLQPSWKNPPSIRDLKQDLSDAQGDKTFYEAKIQTWLDNLNVEGAAKPKKITGRSNVQTKLIRKQAEWRYAALSEPFLSTPDVFNIYPVSREDVKSAEQNQLILNNQFNTQLNKVKFIDELVRTAVDEGTVVIKIGWDSEEEEVTEEVPVFEFSPSSDPAVIQMHQELHQMMESDPITYKQTTRQELQEAHALTMQTGVPYEATQTGTEEVTETRLIKNQPDWEICDYKHVTIDPTCKGDLSKAQFVIHQFETSLSDLEKDGRYKNLEQIHMDSASPLAAPDSSYEPTSFTFKDKPRKKILANEYWGYWDIDGSGIVKPIVATWVGNTLIRLEENPYPDKKLPFVLIPYLPVRKSNYGEPDGALLEDNQKIHGAVMRGMIDILARGANGQVGYRTDALDITNERKFKRGEDYKFNSNVDPRQAFHMHTYNEIPQSAPLMLQTQQNEADEMTGVRAYGATSTGNLGDTATAHKNVMDAASKRETGILRRLAEGIKEVGRKIIAMNAEFLSEEEVVRRTNKEFVTIRRDDLAGNFDLRLAISTAEEDNAKAQELAFMLQTAAPNQDPKLNYMIQAKIARLRKMPELADYLENYKPELTPEQQQLQQLEIQKAQLEIEKLKSEIAENYANAQLDQAKAGTEGAKANNLNSDTDNKDLEYLERESGVTQERELQKLGEQARSNANLKVVDAALDKENPLVGGFAPTANNPSDESTTVSNGLEPV